MQNVRRLAPALTGLLLTASVAHAQTTPSAPAQAATTTAAQSQPAPLSSDDRHFLRQTARGADYELSIARLAVARASSPQVKQYAQQIVSDHDQLNSALGKLAQTKGVQLPTGPGIREKSMLHRLGTLNGAAFDKIYVAEVTRINSDDKDELQKEISSTKDSDVRAFAQEMQQADAKHEQMGQQLKG